MTGTPIQEPNTPSAIRQQVTSFPGIGAIALYLVLLAGAVVMGVVGQRYPLLFLLLPPVFLASAAGLVFLLRWAWALALAAVSLLAAVDLWLLTATHQPPFALHAALNVVFFLYLIRTEIRAMLR